MSDNGKVARISDGFNPHVLTSTGIYLLANIVFGIIWYFLMSMVPDLSPNDPNVQVRLLVGKSTVTIVGMGIVNGLLQILEIVTNGNLVGRIIQSPIGAALFAGVQLSCATLMWIYS